MFKHATMNRAYRLVWSELHDTWVAVAEFARTRGKRTSCAVVAGTLLALGAGGATAADVLAPTALPTGGQVAAGQVGISSNGARMDVTQTSGSAIVNWDSFNIGSQAHVNFAQPSASSVILNRVLGGDGSAIFGRMTANGNVFITNPGGILFAPGAQVDVGGLVASSLGISDANFLAGRFQFEKVGAGGTVTNQGSINVADGGFVALIAPQVGNSGTIHAPGGSIGIAAGDSVNLDFDHDGLLSFQVNVAAAGARADNSGVLIADGGRVVMNAQAKDALLSTVLNNDGVIRARSLETRNGEIWLGGGNSGVVSVTGTLDASGTATGQHGGTVKVLGEYVGLFGQARIDVSGVGAGGTALVGGNWQGKGPEQNASATYVGKDVSINADGVGTGDGGKVVVWADRTTRFNGAIRAHGGNQSGDGGLVEVSGKRGLIFAGNADLRAPGGNVGTLLLDPDNLTITAGAANAGTNVVCTPNGCAAPVTVGDFTDVATGTASMTDGTLTAQLGLGNVSVQATDSIDASSGITVNVNNKILTYTAASIKLGGTYTTGGTLNLSFTNTLDLHSNTYNVAAVTATANGAGAGTIEGPNAATTWDVSGGSLSSAAGVIGFSGANTLQGGNAIDTFTLAAASTANIKGGTGLDVLALAGNTLTGSYAGEGAGGTITGIGSATISGPATTTGVDGSSTNVSLGFTDVTSLTTNVAGTGTLTGSNNASAWSLSGTGGTYTDGAGVASFSGFANLTGGAAIDSFTGAVGSSLSGAINDGGDTTTLGGAIQTGGNQTYTGAVVLGADTALTGVGVSFASTVKSDGTNRVLTVTDSGTTTFDGAVGSAVAGEKLASLTVNGGGTTVLNGGTVTTTGAQTYNDAVTLGAATTLSGVGNTFASTVNGAQTLSIIDSGTTTFGGIVGGGPALTSLTTDAGGSTAINGGAVTTTGAQTYNDAVTLGAATTLSGVGNTFASTVNGGQTLSIIDSGTTTFGGTVGGGTALTSLTTDAGGSTAINGGAVTTTAAQTYNDAVTLGAGTLLTGVGNTFVTTVNGAQTLSIIDSGTTTFGGIVGLTSLTTDAGGSTAINSGAVTTTGAQSYNDAVTANGLTITAGGAVSAVNAANDFTGTLTVTGNGIQVTDGNALTVALNDTGNSAIQAGGNLAISGNVAGNLVTVAGATAFGGTTVGGFMDVTASGAITQSGILNITGNLWMTSSADIILKSLNSLGGTVSLIAAGSEIWLNATRIEVGTVRPLDSSTTNVGITAARVTLEAPNGSAFITTTGAEGLIRLSAPLSATPALTILANGVIGDANAPTIKGLRVETNGLVKVVGDGVGDGTIFLVGDDAFQPKYEFSGDPLHRAVKYNGVDATNAQLTGALDAAYLDIRNLTTEIRESGFAKENASKVLRRGVVTSAGPGQPAVDDSTGMAGLESCDGTFGDSRLACQ